MNSLPANRPPFEYLGYYNVVPADVDDPNSDQWREKSVLPELTLDEFFDVQQTVVDVLSRYGKAFDLLDQQEDDFYAWDDKFFDRTQKVEVVTSERLSAFLALAMPALQEAMSEYPLWRVWFLANDDLETRFTVYPDQVQFHDSIVRATLLDSLAENVKRRRLAATPG